MSYTIKLSKNCKEVLFDDYEDICERRTTPKTAVEDEMTRHSLEIAQKEGWVESFSKNTLH